MPAVASGNQHGIHIGPLGEELAHIAIHRTILAALFAIHDVLGRITTAFQDITDSDPLHILFCQHPVQIRRTAAPEANSTHDDAFAGRHRSVTSQRGSRNIIRQRDCADSHRSPVQKLAPRQCITMLSAHMLIDYSVSSPIPPPA